MIDLFEKCAKPSLAAEAKRLGIYPYFHALESKQDVEVIMAVSYTHLDVYKRQPLR